jgi:hypothetical protein
MDCFAALAMTRIDLRYDFTTSRRDAPEWYRKRRPQKKRAQGKPGARCTRGLVCNVHKEMRHTSIQVQRRASGLPCAMVYGL